MIMKSVTDDLYVIITPKGSGKSLEVAKKLVNDLLLESTQWFCEDPYTTEASWEDNIVARMETVAAHAGTKSAYQLYAECEEADQLGILRREYNKEHGGYIEIVFNFYKPTKYNVVDIHNHVTTKGGFIIGREHLPAYVRKNGPTIALGLKRDKKYARKNGVFPKADDIVWSPIDDNEALVHVDVERGAKILRSRTRSRATSAQKRLITYDEIDAINTKVAEETRVKYTPRRYHELPRWIKIAEACLGKREANRILKDFIQRWNLNEKKNQEKLEKIWWEKEDKLYVYKRLSAN